MDAGRRRPDRRAGGRRRVEAAAPRPDRVHVRRLDGPPPAATRRGSTHGPIHATIHATIHPGERETQTEPAVTPGVRDASSDREPVVHRGGCDDTAGRLARRVAGRLHAAPVVPTAASLIARNDPAGGPGADDPVEEAVPDGGDPLSEAVPVGRSGPTDISSAGRGVLPGGGAAPATAVR